MAVLIHQLEVPTAISAANMLKILVLDDVNIIPKIIPQAVKSIEILEGNGGPGTIKKTTYVEGGYVKDRIDAIDIDNFAYAYTKIEGAIHSDALEKVSYNLKLVPSPDGGCISNCTIQYYTKDDAVIDENLINAGEAKIMAMFKIAEAYPWQILMLFNSECIYICVRACVCLCFNFTAFN